MRTVFKAQRNMSQFDRVIRLLLGLGCLSFSALNPSAANDILLNGFVAIFGAMNIASSIVRICPVYVLVNYSTLNSDSMQSSGSESSESDQEKKSRNTYLDKLGWPSLRIKLLLSVVVPMFFLFLLFAHGFYKLTHQLELKELAAPSMFATELALKLHQQQTDSGSLTENEFKLVKSNTENINILVVHRTDGTQIQSPFTINSNDPGLVATAMEEFSKNTQSVENSLQGMLMQGSSHYIWSSIAADRGDVWATIVFPAPENHNIFDILLSPKLLLIFLGCLWLGVWSSIYIVNKFVEKMSESAGDLRYQMLHDPLTNLPNMMRFEEQLSNRILATNKIEQGISVALLDLSGFRDINDTLGYKLGNSLLKQVAVELQKVVEPEGSVMRVGGDVFCIICNTTIDQSGSSLLANRIHDSLEVHKELEGVPLAIHGRVGISCYPVDSTEPSELFRLADIALAEAKQTHLKTSHYQYENDTHSVRKLSLLARLRGAIENNELSLVYQPKVNIQSKSVVGVEALVRWVDSEYGAVSPIEFVTWAEKSGLIDKLTHWVLRSAEQQNREWRARGIQIPIAVNLSPLNLHDPHLVPLIHDLQVNGSFEKGMLELELTENAVMSDPAMALKTMTTLNNMGIKFAIDDFGTGLSSFTYLRKFPISHLKIDRVFVMDPDRDDRDAILLKSMINLGHSLQCVVTAEGVEDQHTIDRLVEHDCDYIQGYHVCKPLTADDLVVWYSGTEWNSTSRVA